MKTFKLFFITILLLFSGLLLNGQKWSPEQVYYGKGGELTYTPDEKGNIIPDFSHVGYRYGDEAIPDVPVVVQVDPVEGDDGATIQAAIESLYSTTPDANGFRGAVLLKAGTYQVNGQIKIEASGIVLRGEGDTDEGTVIIAEGTSRRDLISVGNGSSRSLDTGSKVDIHENYVPLGRNYVIVADASAYATGEQIVLYRPGTENWISDIKMDQLTPSEGTNQWSASSYSFYFERLVTNVNGDTIFFRNPVVMAMEEQYGGGSVYKFSFDRLQNVGIENLCLKSAYTSETDEEHSWKAIAYNSVEHSWVRNVTSWYFAYSCVSLDRNARLVTVENSHCREPKSIITGGRRYSFNLVGSLCLFKECTTTEGRHDFVNSSRVTGPNVFTQCSASNTHADIGPHHRWAMGTLYDVIETDGEINVQDRDNSGSGHGWAGANTVFWNCSAKSSVCQSPWTSAKNYNFGFQGEKDLGWRTDRPDGVWVGHNRPGIFPASLYQAQLDQRLNDTRLFSAISQLEQLNDSTFLMSFSLPINSSRVNQQNFTVGGTAGIEDNTYTVEQNDDYSVTVTFTNIGILPTFSTVVVNAGNLTSMEGQPLEGLVEAVFTEPDKRPVVSGIEMTVNNENDFTVASSTKPGNVYIIKFGSYPQTKAELDSLVSINEGRSAPAPDPGVSVAIITEGLSGGLYNYYATDMDGRVSKVGSKWLRVEETGPVTGVNRDLTKQSVLVYQAHGQIVVDPGYKDKYSLEIFSITGKMLLKTNDLRGKQYFDAENYPGIVIIRTLSGSRYETVRISTY